jgi:hypothetical protein
LGVIAFNSTISGTLYNSSYCGFKLANASGNLLLTKVSGTNGGKIGVFTEQPSYDFHIAGDLYAKSIITPTLTPTTLKIGEAAIYWDSTNSVLKINGGNLVVEKDVIALGSTDSESDNVGYLSQLLDVSVSDIQDGQVLVWDSALSKWVNQTVAFDGGGTDTDLTAYARKSYVQENYVSKTDYNTEVSSLKTSISNCVTSSELSTQLSPYALKTNLADGSVTKVGTSLVGSSTQPIYLNNGIPTQCGTKLDVDITGTAAQATKLGSANVGTTQKPIYLSAGTPTACGDTLAVSITGNAATATTATTAGSATSATAATYANKLGTSTTSTYDAGSDLLPVYFTGGIPKACATTLAVSVTGNAETATKLKTERKIFGNSFDGTTDIKGPLIIGSSSYDSTKDNYQTIIVGSGFQISADNDQYNGIISFNRQIVGGDIFNKANCAYQLADISGNLLLSRFKDSDSANGGSIGIFTTSPRADVDIAGALIANSTTTDRLTIGSATLTWDETNKALKVSGGSIIAENDVIALNGTTDGTDITTTSISSDSTLSIAADGDLSLDSLSTVTMYGEVVNIESGAEMKINATEGLTIQGKDFDTIISKINELAKAAGKSTI